MRRRRRRRRGEVRRVKYKGKAKRIKARRRTNHVVRDAEICRRHHITHQCPLVLVRDEGVDLLLGPSQGPAEAREGELELRAESGIQRPVGDGERSSLRRVGVGVR